MSAAKQTIIALYARGMTVRDIKATLEQQYRIEVSPDFISSVTDAVHAEATEWQNRPLERMYPLVFLTRCSCASTTKAPCATKPCFSPWGSLPTAHAKC